MQKKHRNYSVRTKKQIKSYSRVSILLLVLLIGIQQTNIFSALSNIHANAQENLLVIETDAIYEGEEATLIVSRSTEDEETIELTLPEEIAIDVEKSEENFSDTTAFTFDEENNSVEISYAEGTSDQSVELYISAEVAGSYRISATSTNEVSSDLDIIVHEALAEEQTTDDEQSVAEAIRDDQTDVEEETTTVEETDKEAPQVDSQTRATTRADENEVSVSTWEEFRSAYNNASVTKIILANDITAPSAVRLTDRRTSIEIDGQGNTLALRPGHSLAVNAPSNSGETPLFHMHDIRLENASTSNMDIEGSWSFIAGHGTNPANTRKWKFKLGNITTTGTEIAASRNISRILRAYAAEITLYGKLDLTTRAENFYAGSVVIEPGTDYTGKVTVSNYSVIWYQLRPTATDTAADNVFDVGQGATVRLQNITNGTSYPAIFDYYSDMIIREDATFYASMNGNTVRFDRLVNGVGSTFTAKKGSVVNLTSRSVSGYATVNFDSNNGTFTVEPGASMYIVGATSAPTVQITSGSGNKFIMDNPKQYDLRNRGTGYALNMSNGNSMEILESDIDLWNMGVDILGPSSATYSKVGYLTASGAPASQKVTSSVDELQSDFKTNKYRRIAGMNTSPEVLFSEITDADLSVTTRVKIGTTPDDAGFDENGDINFIDVFSSLNQSQVTLTSSDNSISYELLGTDENGYVIYSFSDFLKAGTILSASSVRGDWKGDESTIIVQDVTPPEPAVLDGDVKRGQTTIKGIDGEPGATVTYTINGVDATDDEGTVISSTIREDGTWEIAVPSSGLATGDELQIFLTDTVGNKNPVVDTDFHDATFKAATMITVVDGQLAFDEVPDNLSFGTLQISSTDEMYPVVSMDNSLSVIDSRAVKSTWTVTAALVEELYNATYDSTLPLVYVKDGSEITLSEVGTPIYTYTSPDDEVYSISDTWYGESEDGLYVQANSGQARVGEYTGAVKWTLADVPANK